MKKSNEKTVSTAEGSPQVFQSQTQALATCNGLGNKYTLITNDEWQTIARNIEMVPSNWKNQHVGGGVLNVGHADKTPNETLPASSDTNPCYLTESSCGDNEWHLKKRTHSLSNGEVIWDFSGNAWEWVKDGNDFNYPVHNGKANSSYISQITAENFPTARSLKWGLTTTPRIAKDQFGPSGNYKALTWLYRGLGYAWIDGSYGSPGGAVGRGGSYGKGLQFAGIFTVNLAASRVGNSGVTGFRCVYRP